MPTLADRLLAFWTSVGVSPRPGVSAQSLAAFEGRHGVTIPPDLRDYFAAVDGMDPDVRDDLFFRFVPLAECVPSADQGGPLNTYVVAEHRLGGFSYVIHLDTGSVSLWDDDWVQPVAPSFADFLELYLSSPGRLFPSDEPDRS